MDKLKVASAQIQLVDNDFDGNMARAEEMVREVMNESSVDLLLFSECCIEGMDFNDYHSKITSALVEKIDQFWRRMATMSGINILTGVTVRRGGDLFDSSICYGASGGILARYDKTHLYGKERDVFCYGDGHVLFDLKGFTIGMLICADLGFPEYSRVLAKKGAEVFAVPSSWSFPFDDLWFTASRMRAVENGCYLVSSNRYGAEISGRKNCGNSTAVSPYGTVLANLGFKQRGYFITTLEKSEIAKARKSVNWLEMVRPELYV